MSYYVMTSDEWIGFTKVSEGLPTEDGIYETLVSGSSDQYACDQEFYVNPKKQHAYGYGLDMEYLSHWGNETWQDDNVMGWKKK